MKLSTFRKLHDDLRVSFKLSFEVNPINSVTDPTQDCPIRNIQFAANGLPINCKTLNTPYNNLSFDKMTTIDRRLRDNFDVLSELLYRENGLHDSLKQIKSTIKKQKNN